MEERMFILCIYGFSKRPSNKKMERNSINQEVKYLRKHGATVDMIERGTFEDIKNAFEDPEVKLIVTSGHGAKSGYIQTADGGLNGNFL